MSDDERLRLMDDVLPAARNAGVCAQVSLQLPALASIRAALHPLDATS